MIAEYMRKKKDGLTLREKIHTHLEAIKSSTEGGLVELLESFFAEEKDKGTLFHVRRANFMVDRRLKNVIDEVEERMRAQKIEEEKEAKRDMTYDEFISQYLDHIEGRVDADARLGNRPQTAEEEGGAASKAQATEEAKGEDGKEQTSEKLNESSMSRGKSRGEDLNKSKDSMLAKDDYKYEIP